ncbi:MAG: DUF1343 domain-containing protein [Planctomycetota bacterium]|nr:DUF1343 domain-containing protein [Planctomycetota bacterium]
MARNNTMKDRLPTWLTSLALIAGTIHAQASPVRPGIDLLEQSEALADLHVGLITNHTGRTSDGRSTLSVLLASKRCKLTALFAPEHGFHGIAEGTVADSSETTSGLRIHSLYGATRKPTPEQLAGLDALVFDIQDIGCRFYTYIATMRLAMEAAAAADIAFIVLDRPNPIGGEIVSGPVLDAGKESFVGCHTIPVRHGMTVGELALMMNEERRIGCRLRIIKLENWQRSRCWDQTGLTWINPSPNMRSLTQAFLYPGIGLLEFTNLSVGRGTDTPFEIIGAPWMKGRRLARHLNAASIPGVTFVPIRFTPDASKFKGEACSGINIIITDRATFRSLPTGLHIAHALLTMHKDDWQPDRYQRLLADDSSYNSLIAGKDVATITRSWRKELQAFTARRKKHLLY